MRTRAMRQALSLWTALAAAAALLAIGAAQASAEPEITTFELERSTAQAGGHPNIFLRLSFTTKEQERNEQLENPKNVANECFCTDPRTFTVHFPAGFIGNPHAIPSCTLAQLGLYRCPPDSQVGISSALFGQQFVYNMEPRPGEPGLLATRTPLLGSPVFTILRARTNSDYGLDATTPDIFHLFGLVDLRLWLWGVPTDPANDKYRAAPGRQFQKGCGVQYPQPCFETPVDATAPPAPYLQAPTSCEGPLTASVDATYYSHDELRAETSWAPTTGCDLLGFNPSLIAKPTTESADSPSGLDVVARVPQQQSPTVPSPSELKSLKLVLPKGLSINPNAADGKSSCTDIESGIGTLAEAICPQSSKIGTLSIDSSALPAPINGAMYLGEPKPGDKYRLIFAADGFETHVKLEGTVELDQSTGRVVARFEDLPQSPLQEFDIHIFGADRGLLATPTKCGAYTVESEFVPWASEVLPIVSTDSFEINHGPGGSACPGAARPLAPTMVAGSPDNTAGAYTPLAVRVDRPDGDQNMTGLHVFTPPGFLASLRGVPYCPEQAIAKLHEPGYSGRVEQESPACPVASEVGIASTATGAGSSPLHSPGRVYLAGPYKGAPLSLVVVVPAASGPYDLGVVAVRAAAFVNPATAQITTVSDPMPSILEGIPLRLRSILVNLDRPGFARNPTNCNPFSVKSALSGDEGAMGMNSAFYQVANCAALPFEPKLSIQLQGSSKRRGHPAVRAVLTAAPGEAGLSQTTVSMPKSMLLDNAHIGNVCTKVQFAADACPPESVIGSATAESPLLNRPISGPVILRSSSHKLPDLVVDLHGQIDIELDARIDTTKSKALRTHFEDIPDAPVSKFVLSLDGGKKGLLVNSTSLCKGARKASIRIVGQNGTTINRRSSVRTSCGAGAARRGHRALRARVVR
jgi:hypothetical protein